jgi:hypothetical protein
LKKLPCRYNNFINKLFFKISHYLISTPGIIFSTNSCEEDYLKMRTFFFPRNDKFVKELREGDAEGRGGGRKGIKKRGNRGLITPHPNLYFELLISIKIFVVNFKTFTQS